MSGPAAFASKPKNYICALCGVPGMRWRNPSFVIREQCAGFIAVDARSRSTSRTDHGATTMRRFFAIVVALTLGAGSQTAFAQAGLIDGEVTRVDQSTNKITLRHGPIQKLGMDQGMTMVFSAKDATMLNGVKAGDKVKFDAERVNGQFTVTRIEKTK
jgi:Cu(I)/Ag(I) efflux system protein CusF